MDNKIKISVRISIDNYDYLCDYSKFFKGNLSKTLDKLLNVIRIEGVKYEN